MKDAQLLLFRLVCLLSSFSSAMSLDVIALEVSMGNDRLRFDANLSLPGYGAKAWCVSVNAVPEECESALLKGVQNALSMRLKSPQSLIDGGASSHEHPELFGQDDSCTDNNHVMGRCMLMRTLALYVVDGLVPGDYVEAGVHVGDSAAAVARAFVGRGSSKQMFLFDSFEGMPEANESVDGNYAMELSPSSGSFVGNGEEGETTWKGWGHEASADAVAARLSALGVSFPQVVIREGWFNATFSSPPLPGGDVSFLMIDGDWYGSILESLNRWYDHVPPGGVIVLDDFGYWEGARRALGEFLRSRPAEEEFPLFERYGPDILWWIKGRLHNRPQ